MTIYTWLGAVLVAAVICGIWAALELLASITMELFNMFWVSKSDYNRLLERVESLEKLVYTIQAESKVSVPDERDVPQPPYPQYFARIYGPRFFSIKDVLEEIVNYLHLDICYRAGAPAKPDTLVVHAKKPVITEPLPTEYMGEVTYAGTKRKRAKK